MLAEPSLRAALGLRMAGVCFHGNPFDRTDAWSEWTEADGLWERYERTLSALPGFSALLREPEARYEVRAEAGPPALGAFDVFVGQRVADGAEVPHPLCWRPLPAVPYAVFRVDGEAEREDWNGWILREWLPRSRFQAAGDWIVVRRTAGGDGAFEAWVPVRERG